MQQQQNWNTKIESEVNKFILVKVIVQNMFIVEPTMIQEINV